MSEHYYFKIKGAKVPVSEEIYRDYQRSVWRESFKARYRVKAEPSYERFIEDGYQFATNEASVEDIVIDQMDHETLLAALATLNDDERFLIYTLVVNGKTEREVAPMLGISCVAVHKRKVKILGKLKKCFE